MWENEFIALQFFGFFSGRIWALLQLIFDLFSVKHKLSAEECERDLFYIAISLNGFKHLAVK